MAFNLLVLFVCNGLGLIVWFVCEFELVVGVSLILVFD